ncbi:hypothetical protein V1264_012896 [Littorina saxatilis]|uniref:C-type lectin domain-containing protein n=1 Tax=Littorina saxatilis TaxID=31220 RepID=A0AAN9BY60_9CAEN
MASITLRVLTAGLLVLMLGNRSDAYSHSCPSGWTYYGGCCYIVIKEKLAWTDAQVACEMIGGDLVKITSSSENYQVGRLVRAAYTSAWIGLNSFEKSGHYRWIKATTDASYTKWDSHSRYQKCVLMKTNYYWDDYSCSSKNNFVCEKMV